MQLDDLQIELEKVGFVEEYCNGNNQFGKKESTESKAYNTLMKNYIFNHKKFYLVNCHSLKMKMMMKNLSNF